MIDLIIVLLFVVYSLALGMRARRRASLNLEEYFLAGRSIRGWRAGLSMAATQFAADTPLLVSGLIATGGVFLLWRLWVYGIAFLLLAFVFSALWRRAGVLTDAELTEIRYSGSGVLELRVLKAVYYGTVINCTVMAMVLIAAVRIAEIFLPWHTWLPSVVYEPVLTLMTWTGWTLANGATALDSEVASANALISLTMMLLFTGLYSTTGGLRSVIGTDVMQFGFAMLGTLVYAYIVIKHIGGLGTLTDRVVSLYGDDRARQMLSFLPPNGELLLPFLSLVGLQWFFQMNSDGTGYLAQRSMACRTDRDARLAGLVFAWAQILVRSLLWLVIGVGLLILYPFSVEDSAREGFAASREVLFVTGIDELLPVGARGLMVTSLLAALASTIDTHLNWGASYWTNDIYGHLICQRWQARKASDRELVMVARLSTIFIILVSLTVMAKLGSIQTAWFISLLFGAGMGSVLVLRWLWERINVYSELAAVLLSLAVAPILLVATDVEWIRLSAMAAISTLGAVGITFFTPFTENRILRQFYQRVQPVGFWPRTARAVGDDPQLPLANLLHQLRTALLSVLSLFLLLSGLGKLIISSTTACGPWAWLCIAAGMALIPLWWRDLF